jgi:hypothetical protein
MNSLEKFSALQTFVLGMKYLESATLFALKRPCTTMNCVRRAMYIVCILYGVVLIVMTVVLA